MLFLCFQFYKLLNSIIFPIIRRLTEWLSVHKTLAQFLITGGIAALLIFSAGLVFLTIKLFIAIGAASALGGVLAFVLSPLLPFIVAAIILGAAFALLVIHWKTVVSWFKIGIAVVRDLFDKVVQGPARFLLLLTPIGLVVVAIGFLVSNFDKIKSVGVPVLSALLRPFRAIINIIKEIAGLLSKLGGFFSQILNLGGPDSHLARTLADQRKTRRIEAEELSSRAQALTDLPNRINNESPTNLALAAQRASFSYTSPVEQQRINRGLPTTRPAVAPVVAPVVTPVVTPALTLTLVPISTQVSAQVSAPTPVPEKQTTSSLYGTARAFATAFSLIFAPSLAPVLTPVVTPYITSALDPTTRRINSGLHVTTPVSTPALAPTLTSRRPITSGLHATARALAPRRNEISSVELDNKLSRILDNQREATRIQTLVDASNISRPDTRQEQLQTLINRQEVISNISTTNVTNRNNQQTDVKIDNRYDIEGVTDPEEVANIVADRQIAEIATFAR